LCECNYKARVILIELRTDPQTVDTPIVLIANIDRKPINDDNLFFIQGDVTDETLERANLDKAATVVILGNDDLDTTIRDAKVVLTTLTVESLNPHAYTIAELADKDNIQHCKRANVDEVVVSSELSSSLIAQATLDHGLANIISEILRTDEGCELYRVSIPPHMVGQQFIDAFMEIKKEHQGIVLAVHKGNSGASIVNPPVDYRLEEQDCLIVVALERPQFSGQEN
jgi:voltage-gated potassium channel